MRGLGQLLIVAQFQLLVMARLSCRRRYVAGWLLESRPTLVGVPPTDGWSRVHSAQFLCGPRPPRPHIGVRCSSGSGVDPRLALFGDVDDVFPPGTLSIVQKEKSALSLSPAMCDMERCLERALIVCVGRTRPTITPQEVALVIQSERGLSQAYFSVHPYFLENCLVVFDNHSNKDRILLGGPIKTDRFLLLLRQWSRLVQGVSRPYDSGSRSIGKVCRFTLGA